MQHHIHVFSNGITLIHRQVSNTKIAHCAFTLDIGSRDELESQHGIAHFWEHMAFKGTHKRKAYHIINCLENVGGDLNAFTTKEKICFHASLLDTHFEKAVDLLSDITFNSTFPEKEIQKECGVILEEMAMYEDNPADAIIEQFDELMFAHHPLGKNIVGTAESVKGFKKEDFLTFLSNNMNTERLVFSSVSALPFDKVLRIVEKYIKEVTPIKNERFRTPIQPYFPQKITTEKSTSSQIHCVLGNRSYAITDERRVPFALLVNILGGIGMNSRLNMTLREKYGLVYSVDASYSAYIDSGNVAVSFATEKKTFERTLNLCMKEIKKVCENPLGTLQLHNAKQQFIGQLAMAEESNSGYMLMMGKSILDLGEVENFNSIVNLIQQTSASHLQEMANEVFEEKQLSMLTYIPEE